MAWMRIILAFLPMGFFVVLYILLLGIEENEVYRSSGWRGVFLKTSVVWGAILVLSSELLGLLDALTLLWVILFWAVAIVFALFLCLRGAAIREALDRLKRISWRELNRPDVLVLSALIATVVFLMVLAWKVVPNNTDSLLYHMSRVMHWMQNKNLDHYATQYQAQLWSAPWAEYVILHLRLLSGTDQLANLVQWFSMVGSLIGVSLITGILGAGVREQILASFFVVSIPMGILQATSTQNDYVTSFWLVCLAYFVVQAKIRRLKQSEWVFFAVVTGLGMLTKALFYFYAFPILLWYFVPRLVKRGIRKTLIEGVTFAAIILVLNSGFLTRNFITYGTPFGAVSWLSRVSETRWDPRTWIPAVMKQISLDFVSTIPKFNAVLTSSVRAVEDGLGLETTSFEIIPGFNNEDLAANPLHMLLVLETVFFLLVFWRRKEAKLARGYAIVILSTFVVFSLTLAYLPYYVRFHLPFFVLWGAVFGAIAYFIDLKKLVYLASLFFLVASIPWLLFNQTRPVLPLKPYTSLGGSIFQETSEVVLFANWHKLRAPYMEVTGAVLRSGCKDVGLRIDSHDIEYPYWRLLDAPESGLRLEIVDEYRYVGRYLDRSFEPCAIICSICGEREEFKGLIRLREFGEGVVLFGNP